MNRDCFFRERNPKQKKHKILLFSVLYEDYQEYGSAFRLWANSESKLSDTLMAVSKSLDYSIENLKAIVSTPYKRKARN